jgi:hypothetical protein
MYGKCFYRAVAGELEGRNRNPEYQMRYESEPRGSAVLLFRRDSSDPIINIEMNLRAPRRAIAPYNLVA